MVRHSSSAYFHFWQKFDLWRERMLKNPFAGEPDMSYPGEAEFACAEWLLKALEVGGFPCPDELDFGPNGTVEFDIHWPGNAITFIEVAEHGVVSALTFSVKECVGSPPERWREWFQTMVDILWSSGNYADWRDQGKLLLGAEGVNDWLLYWSAKLLFCFWLTGIEPVKVSIRPEGVELLRK